MSALETTVKPAPKKTIKDTQTGKDFEVIPEGPLDVVFAWLSAAYSLAVIGLLIWLVLNMLYGQVPTTPEQAEAARRTLAHWLKPLLLAPASKLILYTAIGGAIGASVNNLRSFISWHAEERGFGWRFIWKYLAMPPLGGTLAVLVYGILQGGMTVFTGGSAPQSTALTSLSAWATGTLAGYGSHKVFKWLDDKVNSLFKVDSRTVAVPDVKGKSLEEAKRMVVDAQLEVGTTSEAPASSDQVGKIIAQAPEAGTQLDCGSKVDLTVGIAGGPENDANTPGATDLTAKPQGNGAIPHNGKPDAVAETAVAAGTTATALGTVVGTDVSVNTEDLSAQPSSDDTSSVADDAPTNDADTEDTKEGS